MTQEPNPTEPSVVDKHLAHEITERFRPNDDVLWDDDGLMNAIAAALAAARAEDEVEIMGKQIQRQYAQLTEANELLDKLGAPKDQSLSIAQRITDLFASQRKAAAAVSERELTVEEMFKAWINSLDKPTTKFSTREVFEAGVAAARAEVLIDTSTKIDRHTYQSASHGKPAAGVSERELFEGWLNHSSTFNYADDKHGIVNKEIGFIIWQAARATAPSPVSEQDKKIMAAGFDHPCKGTCSGWQQGFERGVLSATAPSPVVIGPSVEEYTAESINREKYHSPTSFRSGCKWYREQTGAVVLPERRLDNVAEINVTDANRWHAMGWNACLDEIEMKMKACK